MQEMSRRRFLDLTAQTTAMLGAGRLLGFPVLAAAQPATGALPALSAIDAFVNRHIRERGAPGLVLGLADRNGVLAARTYGHRDVKTGQPIETDDLFEIGSITKSFIAISLLQLREAGKLDLGRPIREYLPWLRIESSYAPITVHHLLSHTSGLPNALGLPLDLSEAPLWTGHAPGEHFHYCNLGYDILGRLLETLDGRKLKEILPARIFQPLGMTATSPVISHDLRPRMPVSYWPLYDDRPFQRHGPLTEAPYLAMDNSAGCIVSTAHDMALYMRMLLNRGGGPKGPVISEESFALFSKPAIPAPSFGEGAGYGYGIAIQPVEGRTILRHTGGMVSFCSAMQVDMDAGFGAFASVNASLAGYRPNPVAAYALAALRAERDSRPIPPMPEPDDPYKVPNTADYIGAYTAPDGRKLILASEGDLLRLTWAGERIPLEKIAPDTFIVSHPEFALFALSFGRDVKGAVVEASYGSDWYAGERYTGPRTFEAPAEWQAFAGHYRNDSPWEGSARIVLRNGRLWAGGDTPLVPLGSGLFRIGDEDHSPDRARFGNVVNGRALVATFNGVDYRRIET
jgi:CubicO group peptidase (beta-lactamase class C family)